LSDPIIDEMKFKIKRLDNDSNEVHAELGGLQTKYQALKLENDKQKAKVFQIDQNGW
jgi:hypothetical protein